MWPWRWFVFVEIIHAIQAARILGLFPTPSISHQVVFRPLMEELARRGHHVVAMTTDPVKHKKGELDRLIQINVSFAYEIFRERFNFVQLNANHSDPQDVLIPFTDVQMDYIDEQLKLPEIKKLLNDPDEKFDVCFVEIFGQPMYAVKDHFNCSLILISSMCGWTNNYNDFGNPWHPFLYPHFFSMYVGEMSFWQRMYTLYQHFRYFYLRYYIMSDKFETLAKKHFKNHWRHVDEIESKADMMFLNVNPLLGDIRPTVPAIIYMGGIHIKSIKPLPKSYQEVLDKSKNGAIFFSLGSNVKSVDVPLEKRIKLLKAFSELPYTVLWKWENETMEEKPNNVFISRWMPQTDILAHPNVKLFITQGGQQSMEESIHRKVPLIGIPFIGDQFLNVKRMVRLGIGIEMQIDSIEKDAIKDTIEEVINNASYRQAVAKLSDLLLDQPNTALERAVWWTEYVIRHGGAGHLRAPGADATYIRFFFLDVVGLVLLCCSIVVVGGLVVLVTLGALVQSFLQRNMNVNINLNHLKKLQ